MKRFRVFHIRAADAVLCLPIAAGASAAVASGFTPEELTGTLWLIVLISAALTFLLTRTRAGIAVLFLAGSLICAGAYFLQFPVPLWGFLLFELAALVAYLYRTWSVCAARADAGAASPERELTRIAAFCAVGLLVAAGLYFGVVRPLHPATRELKLITELKHMELLEVLGVSRTETILDPEMRSDAPPEDTEQGDEAGEEERDAPSGANDATETPTSPETETEWERAPEEAETVRYEFQRFNPLWLLTLLPVLIAAAYGLRMWRRRRWEAAVRALPPADAAANYYRFFLTRLGRAGYPKPERQTLREYAAGFAAQLEPFFPAEDFTRLTEIYERAVYGRSAVSEAEVEAFAEAYAAFYPALRREVGAVKYYLTAFRY